MRARVLVLALLLSACGAPPTQQQIQTALDAAKLACQTLIANPELGEPEAVEWCHRFMNSCREVPVASSLPP